MCKMIYPVNSLKGLVYPTAETLESSLLDRFADLTVQGRCVCLESSRGRKFLSIECTNGQEIVV